MSRQSVLRAICQHTDRAEVVRRKPDPEYRTMRCPTCGLRWDERRGDPVSPLDDDISVRAYMDGRQRAALHEVLGRDVPIAPTKLNGDHWSEDNPAAAAILDQIEAACKERDDEMAAYLKAEPIARRAARVSMDRYSKVQQANRRALQLREALDALGRAVGVMVRPGADRE